MPDLQHLLDRILELDQLTTAGPWEARTEEHTSIPCVLTQWGDEYGPHIIADMLDSPDEEFIALARTALPQLAKALQAVMDLEDESLGGDLQGYEIDQYVGYNQALRSVREAITDAMEGN